MAAKILIVEDNLDTRELLHFYLIEEGFSVITACDGGEGHYMAHVEKPDLLITDLNMPTMDGITLVTKLRAEPESCDLPIILMTAYGKTERDAAVRAGANRAIEKPTSFESLINVVQELLNERKQ